MKAEQLLQKSVSIVWLGCEKNRVDTEEVMYRLRNFGFRITDDESAAEILIVNTCAYIEPARRESIEAVLDLSAYKETGACEKLIVVGCLPERYLEQIAEILPEVDCFLGVRSADAIIRAIASVYACELKDTDIPQIEDTCARIITTPKHYAYLKIAEGCNNKCSYCVIPNIRGRYKSKPMEALKSEAKALVNKGAREIILTAHDITRYGEDIYKEHRLPELIRILSKIDGLEWIRLEYCYPQHITDELITEISGNPKVCKYINIPMQHVDDFILREMNVDHDYVSILELLDKIRNADAKININSAFITGFPGEGRREFKNLTKFLSDYKLNYAKFTPYSRETDTDAYYLKGQVSRGKTLRRLKKLQRLQNDITERNNISQIGQVVRAICDRGNDGEYVLRSEHSSPNAGPVIYVYPDHCLRTGDIYDIEIVSLQNKIDFRGELK